MYLKTTYLLGIMIAILVGLFVMDERGFGYWVLMGFLIINSHVLYAEIEDVTKIKKNSYRSR